WASRSFERALSDGTKFYNYKPNTARIEALSRWAVALSDAGLTEQALARADEACRIDENAYWALFSKGYVFDKFGAYEQAKVYYDRAWQADRSIPAAHHNLIGVLESQG